MQTFTVTKSRSVVAWDWGQSRNLPQEDSFRDDEMFCILIVEMVSCMELSIKTHSTIYFK